MVMQHWNRQFRTDGLGKMATMGCQRLAAASRRWMRFFVAKIQIGGGPCLADKPPTLVIQRIPCRQAYFTRGGGLVRKVWEIARDLQVSRPRDASKAGLNLETPLFIFQPRRIRRLGIETIDQQCYHSNKSVFNEVRRGGKSPRFVG